MHCQQPHTTENNDQQLSNHKGSYMALLQKPFFLVRLDTCIFGSEGEPDFF